MDQITGRDGLDILVDEESFLGRERERKSRIDGRRGMARLRENRRAEEKAKAEMKSRKNEWLG